MIEEELNIRLFPESLEKIQNYAISLGWPRACIVFSKFVSTDGEFNWTVLVRSPGYSGKLYWQGAQWTCFDPEILIFKSIEEAEMAIADTFERSEVYKACIQDIRIVPILSESIERANLKRAVKLYD